MYVVPCVEVQTPEGERALVPAAPLPDGARIIGDQDGYVVLEPGDPLPGETTGSAPGEGS